MVGGYELLKTESKAFAENFCQGGTIRGFMNDGSIDFKNHYSVDSLAFGHCDYAYRNLGRPSKLRIRQESNIFEVIIDGKPCFSSDKVHKRIATGRLYSQLIRFDYHLNISSVSPRLLQRHPIHLKRTSSYFTPLAPSHAKSREGINLNRSKNSLIPMPLHIRPPKPNSTTYEIDCKQWPVRLKSSV